jgi:SAM-dependent methyltransferase
VWSWDETLYAGSAAYYLRGRFPYPQELADALRAELALDGTGRLLDVGCGPGPLTLLLAPLFEQAVGVDADAAMLEAARLEAKRRRVANAEFVELRAEELPAGLGRFRLVSFAQSFHWMDRRLVAGRVKMMLEPHGRWLHVWATTTHGVDDHESLPAPAPPHDRIGDLVRSYLGPVRRAGQGTLPEGTPAHEEEIMVGAGYSGPTRLVIPAGWSNAPRTRSSRPSSRARRALRICSASDSASSTPSSGRCCARQRRTAGSASARGTSSSCSGASSDAAAAARKPPARAGRTPPAAS